MFQDEREIIKSIQEFQQFHLPRWEELPDFEVYMDQLITLLNRYLNIFNRDDSSLLTPSMVNNYVKLKMMPKPIKKKYERIHIAYLIAITTLKQVLTISEIKEGIELQAKISGLKGAYNLFCEEFENALNAVLDTFIAHKEPILKNDPLTKENIAMKLCTMSLATKLLTKALLEYKKGL